MVQETECRFDGLLDLTREKAFTLFVDRVGLWWTSPFHETGGGVAEAEIEPFAGGSCYEIGKDGQQRVWGTVLSIEQPLFIRLAWQVSQSGEEIADPATASRVMVNFREAGERTRLEIVHNEFLRHGEQGADYMQIMKQPDGWPRIIEDLQQASRSMK